MNKRESRKYARAERGKGLSACRGTGSCFEKNKNFSCFPLCVVSVGLCVLDFDIPHALMQEYLKHLSFFLISVLAKQNATWTESFRLAQLAFSR